MVKITIDVIKFTLGHYLPRCLLITKHEKISEKYTQRIFNNLIQGKILGQNIFQNLFPKTQ